MLQIVSRCLLLSLGFFAVIFTEASWGASTQCPSEKVLAVYDKLNRDIQYPQHETLQVLEQSRAWLKGYETLQGSLISNKTEGLVQWLYQWNCFDPWHGPSSLTTQDALSLRSQLSQSALNLANIVILVKKVDLIVDELIFEVEALDRIERYRRQDIRIEVLNKQGIPIPGAVVELQQINHRFLFGCNIYGWKDETSQLQQDYRNHFANLFNFATLGFYWGSYEQQEGKPLENLREMTALWCRQHGIQTKGHPLVWNNSEPRWLPDDTQQVYQLQLDRITRELQRFKGSIEMWDVVNEATCFDRKSQFAHSPKRTSMWEKIGPFEFPRQAFDIARKANPNALLLINDYEIRERMWADVIAKRDNTHNRIYEDVIEQLVSDDGNPLYDIIGIQSHMHGKPWSTQKTLDVIKRFSRFNMPLHLTETTVVSGPGKWENWQDTTAEGEREQAEQVERFYRTIFSCPEVEALTWWDLSDYRAWQGAPAGLLKKDMSPKPAYLRLRQLLYGDWWTSEKKDSNENGHADFRAYLGEYRVVVTAPDGSRKSSRCHLDPLSKSYGITFDE